MAAVAASAAGSSAHRLEPIIVRERQAGEHAAQLLLFTVGTSCHLTADSALDDQLNAIEGR